MAVFIGPPVHSPIDFRSTTLWADHLSRIQSILCVCAWPKYVTPAELDDSRSQNYHSILVFHSRLNPSIVDIYTKIMGKAVRTGPLPPTVATLIAAYGRTEHDCPILWGDEPLDMPIERFLFMVRFEYKIKKIYRGSCAL